MQTGAIPKTVMSLTAKLIWYIESRLTQPLSLSQVARVHGVSACHVTRLFAVSCDRPLMAYVKARRLSEAARTIQAGGDILDAALGAGYASHEAFTRAFRQHFGVPRALRQIPEPELRLTEPLPMNDTDLNPRPDLPVQIPSIEKLGTLALVGLSGTFDFDNLSGIPALWQAFRPWFGQIDGQNGGTTYGVSYNYRPDGIDYLAGVEVADGSDLPPDFTRLKLPAGRYAVFEHRGHVSGISHTWRAIYDNWLPAAALKMRYDPGFERMDARFDGATGNGLIEIWIPVE